MFSANEFGSGLAYALGFAYGDVMLLPHSGGDYEAQRSWINQFEPGGELRVPEGLFEALEKSGYPADSSFSANDNMVNFAYRMLKHGHAGSREFSIVEIPVTFDDSSGYLIKNNVDVMVRQWLDVIWANADNEAISTLLLHPSETGYKLQTEEKLLSELHGKDIWIGDLAAYAAFWNERLTTSYTAVVENDTLSIQVASDTLAPDISFVVKSKDRFKSVEVRNAHGQKADYLTIIRGEKVFLRKK